MKQESSKDSFFVISYSVHWGLIVFSDIHICKPPKRFGEGGGPIHPLQSKQQTPLNEETSETRREGGGWDGLKMGTRLRAWMPRNSVVVVADSSLVLRLLRKEEICNLYIRRFFIIILSINYKVRDIHRL